MQFTKDNIKPGLKYKHYTYPGKWSIDTVTAVEGSMVYTKDFYAPHLAGEFIEKVNTGLGDCRGIGKLNYFKLVENKK